MINNSSRQTHSVSPSRETFKKVAIVHEMLVKLGGAERVLKTLTEMFPEAPVYTLFYNEKKCGREFLNTQIKTSFLQKYVNWKFPYQFLIRKMPLAIESFDFSDYDLVISSSSAFAHGIITNLETKHVCYCHSPMRYAWDYTNEYKKEKGGKFKQFLISWLLHKVRIWDQIAASRVDQYLANSTNVQKRIQKYYHTDSKVIFPPVSLDRFKVTSEHQNYYLIVSALTGFKRLDLAIEAFNQLGEKLIIIGDGAERKNLQKIANQNIDFKGRLPDSEVTEYLQNCKALIFPGEEDFGITPVEAMACGKPVLGYGKGGLVETVLPSKTGEFFTELSVKSFLKGFEKMNQNYVKYNVKEIRKQAEKFSEEKFKEEILGFIKKIN